MRNRNRNVRAKILRAKTTFQGSTGVSKHFQMVHGEPFAERALQGRGNPLVAITLINDHDPLNIRLYRSMGFVVGRYAKGVRLVITCRHALQQGAPYTWVVGCRNPKPRVWDVLGNAIPDAEPETDIAFLLMRDPAQAKTHVFALTRQDPPIRNGQILYNAGNRCDPVSGVYDVYIARQQPVREIERIAFCKFSSPTLRMVHPNNADDRAVCEREGFLPHRVINMVSRASFSGSPIFDAELNLYGMDVRGSEPGTSVHAEQGDTVICVPTSALYAARERVMPQIKERIAAYL